MTAGPSQAELAGEISRRLESGLDRFAAAWRSSGPVRHLVVDDFLPADWVRAMAEAFPRMAALRRYESWKEHKGIGIDFDRYPPILKAATFAFQEPPVLAATAAITGIGILNPDGNLYSGGLSAMGEGDFLNPHIDNSGNPILGQYRRINVLYYVSPGWNPAWGGNLELWDGKRANPATVEARCNRLVLMNTNRTSFHSVSPIRGAGGELRRCVSNYYFSPESPEGYDYFHVTSFRGRPEQPFRDIGLRLDAAARGLYRRFRPRRAEDIAHRYQ